MHKTGPQLSVYTSMWITACQCHIVPLKFSFFVPFFLYTVFILIITLCFKLITVHYNKWVLYIFTLLYCDLYMDVVSEVTVFVITSLKLMRHSFLFKKSLINGLSRNIPFIKWTVPLMGFSSEDTVFLVGCKSRAWGAGCISREGTGSGHRSWSWT